MGKILAVNNLGLEYIKNDHETTKVLKGISFDVFNGELLGITGESGGGKTSILTAIAGLLPSNGRILSGEIAYDGKNFPVLQGTPRELSGKEIGFVFQDSLAALNPVYTIGFHLSETLIVNLGLSKDDAKEKSLELLRRVNLNDPHRIYRSYPHQLSGGMRQRIMVALAISCSPKLVLADEPTSSLDFLNAKEILALFKNLKLDMGFSAVIVSHDIDLLMDYCDRLLIVHEGCIVEAGEPFKLKEKRKLHEYADKLLNHKKYFYERS